MELNLEHTDFAVDVDKHEKLQIVSQPGTIFKMRTNF